MTLAKNQVQFQKGLSLTEFLKPYGTEEPCHRALFGGRWPGEFVCPECGHGGYCVIALRRLYQCHRCHHQVSIISGTLFEYTKLPLTPWFLGMDLLTLSKNGLSARELKRPLGITYNVAWCMKHKLRQVMKERDDGQPLSGLIPLDEAYWGGECRGAKRGRGAPGKPLFVAAVQTHEEGHPIARRLTKVKGFRKEEIAHWAQRHWPASRRVVSDELGGFTAVEAAGGEHPAILTAGGPASVTLEAFTGVNTMIGNVKNSIHGTYHALSDKPLPRYLAEFYYRFNRRFKLEDMIPRLGRAAVRTPPLPERLLRMAEA